jgi:uncharacterized protein YdeI (YjbR/CyaY-like superfamily)
MRAFTARIEVGRHPETPMGTKDPRIDAYIAKSAPFARPILTHLRTVIHSACPEVEETLKWSMPSFLYKGILCGMAGFKQHVGFGFWKGSLILDAAGNQADEAMGHFGRITSVSQLPSKKILTGYIRQAMALNDQGIKARSKPRAKKKPIPVPADLKAALAKNARARATFEGFSPSNRREYLEWITEARGEDTRKRRLATTIQWLAAGKTRNWKYER